MRTKQFHKISSQFSSRTILIVGDVMLDAYLWGDAERISQEAPVPVIHVNRSNYSPGGAGNVALNLAALSANPVIIGSVGKDNHGRILLDKMKNNGIDTRNVIVDSDVLTTVKTRVIAHNQQVVRVDEESRESISSSIQNKIMERIQAILPKCDAVILEDYNKGLFSEHLIKDIIHVSNQQNVPVYVDPKQDNFNKYTGVRFFKPNSYEFASYFGKEYDEEQFEFFGNIFREETEIDVLMVTRGEKGMHIFSKDESVIIPTKARTVHDVSGAGDTVISTFTLADICGATPQEAAILANYAAGRVCEEVGVVPITLQMLEEMISHHHGS